MTSAARARFEGLFDEHHRAVLGYALRRAGGPHDAADVVAETFLVAWRRIDDVPFGDDTRPWLFGVARRVLANHHRGERRRTQLSARLGEQLSAQLTSPAEGAASGSPDGPLAEVGLAGPLGPALAALAPDDREILLLTAWEGLTPAQIATALDLRGSTVRSRLRRARQRLELALGHPAGGEPTPPPPSRDAVQETAR